MFTFDYLVNPNYHCYNEGFFQKYKGIIDKAAIRKVLLSDGIIGFKLDNNDTNKIISDFHELCNSLGEIPARDAMRRSKSNKSSNPKNYLSKVDPDVVHRPHSEASFSPARPALLGFLCTDIEKDASLSGQTTLIDGNKVWKQLNGNTKKILLNLEIDYNLAVDIPIIDNQSKNKNREWFLEAIGVRDVAINQGIGKLYFKYKTPFITLHPLTRKLSLTNHAFINIKTEEQIISRRLINFENESIDLKVHINEVKAKISENIKTIKWKKGFCIFIDNFRFMHGRLPYDLQSKRTIYIKQFKRFITS